MTSTSPQLKPIGSFTPGAGVWRLILVVLSLLAAFAFIALMTVLLPEDSRAGAIMFDHRRDATPPYPFTVQNGEWVVFFLGLGALLSRVSQAMANRRQVRQGLLPEADEVVLTPAKLGGHAERIRRDLGGRELYMHRLLLRVIWQFQGGKSVSQATEVMKASIELFQHEIDLSFSLMRYLTWLLPTLGFMGSVWGIASGLRTIDLKTPQALKDSLPTVIDNLGVAFYATLMGLILSATLIFIMHLVQEAEERSVNEAGQYCLDHLINKLYVEK